MIFLLLNLIELVYQFLVGRNLNPIGNVLDQIIQLVSLLIHHMRFKKKFLIISYKIRLYLKPSFQQIRRENPTGKDWFLLF